jgi:hypothetical protein
MHTTHVITTLGVSLCILATFLPFAVDAETCGDTRNKFDVGNGAMKTCRFVEKEKKGWCDTKSAVRANCPRTCGFCPCEEDIMGEFQLGRQHNKKRCQNGLTNPNLCNRNKFKNNCPKTCETCTAGSECVLQANHAFPYKDPDDAGYYGYIYSWIGITRDDNDNDACDSELAASWCIYSNSAGLNGTSAYFGNVDDHLFIDDYYDELHDEIVVVKDAAGRKFVFSSNHYYLDADYHPEEITWADHNLAAVMKIKNRMTGEDLNADGWSHETDPNIFTHLPNGDVNQNHKGRVAVTVYCDDDCKCSANSAVYSHRPNDDAYD